MTSTSDRILDLIDAGLQTSDEVGYGHTDRRRDACARCQASAPAEAGDLCAGCRAFLLGDTEDDPVQTSAVPAGPAFESQPGLTLHDCVLTPSQHQAVCRWSEETDASVRFDGCTFVSEPSTTAERAAAERSWGTVLAALVTVDRERAPSTPRRSALAGPHVSYYRTFSLAGLPQMYRGPASGPHAAHYPNPVAELPVEVLDRMTLYSRTDAQVGELDAWCPICGAAATRIDTYGRDLAPGPLDLPEAPIAAGPRLAVRLGPCGHVVESMRHTGRTLQR